MSPHAIGSKPSLAGKIALFLLASVLSYLLQSSANAQQAPVFVALRTTQDGSTSILTTVATTTIAAPGTGWSYSAAAPVAGTKWNQILQPNPKFGAGSGNGTIGTYTCNSANNLALVSSSGSTTAIHLTATININGLEAGNSTRTEPNTGAGGNTNLGPNGLMDEAWRIYEGGNTATYTFSGLTPNASYFLYCYGSTTTAGQGCTFTLPTANAASDDTASKATAGGNSGDIFAFDGTNYSLTAPGTTWCVFHAVANSAGTIAVTGSKVSSGVDYENGFQLIPYPLPVITAQPTFAGGSTSETASTGAQVIMSVMGSGSGTITYQWEKNGTPLTGDTNAMLTLSDVQLADSGSYSATVSNPGGGVASNSITLNVVPGTVNPVPVITSQPVGQAVLYDTNVTLTVTASGNAMTYQWYKNGSAIATGTTDSLNFPTIQPGDTATYLVTVSNDGGTATSNPATLTVLSPNLVGATYSPGTNSTGLCPDTRLTINFMHPPTVGTSGTIRICDASTNAIVDTISASSATQVKTIGTLANFNYYPLIITGTQVTLYPRNNILAYNKTYYVTIDPGVFQDAEGAYGGISDTTTWRFTTKAFGPSTGATYLTVASDGSGDFCTVQAALDFIPAGNTAPTTVFVRDGTYTEINYFYGKSYVTVLGQDRNQTIIAYPNNNNFNPAGGGYHRMVFAADHSPYFTIANLTIHNTTPPGGSQAEALILNGNNSVANTAVNVSLYSHQDTLQINGQGYVADSYIEGDVDFMWGQGPNFFNNCVINAVTSGGYYCQVRNPVTTTNHGNVYLNCTLEANSGVSGMYLARIDPTAATGYPYSEVVFLNCVMGSFITPAGWLLLNTADQTAASAPNVHDWEYNSHDSSGNPINVSSRAAFSTQLTMANNAATIANYSNPTYVLGNNWTPQLAPIITLQPAPVMVSPGQPISLSVATAAIPDPTYQWMLYGAPIPGATGTNYTIPSASGSNAGSYTVVATNASGTATSVPATVIVTGGPPVIATQPAGENSLAGGSASFSVLVVGAGPFAYQWNKNGTAITGATGASYTIASTGTGDAGSYTVTVSNSGGSITSNPAALTISAPAISAAPPLPAISGGTFSAAAYGAIADGTTNNTSAIQNAINAAKTAGGGTVELPPALLPYECGPITLYSNMNLQIDGGATLQALPFGTYPNSNTSPSHFITVNTSSTNVEISGAGDIDGNGLAWWNAYNAGVITARPRMLMVNHTDTMLVTGVTFSNAPTENLAFASANHITVYGVTVTAPGSSPNTDGIDPAGSHYLIQNCSIADGDDNIAIKPGGSPATDINIVDCSFGTGHGLSFGGQTNGGYNGVTVNNCYFNATSTGLRMKADATEGGLVQNVTYSNITMTNVASPIVFYSYYNILSPTAVTPATVNAYNETPPNSLNSATLPGWTNITINNLTATGASGYSVIWGLPLAGCLISNVTLNNVQISGGSGLQIYDAANVQLTGSSNVGSYTTCNALAITGQPQSELVAPGGTANFTVATAGASGVNGVSPTFQWNLNGAPIANGTNADGSVYAGCKTAALTVSKVTEAESGAYTVTVSNSLDGYNVTTSSLVTNSIPVSGTSSAATLTIDDAFATYVSGYGLDPAGNGAPAADYGGDGISNLMEFVLGGNPTASTTSVLPTSTTSVINGNPYLVFQFNENKAAETLQVFVEYSTDLQTWITAVDGQNGITIANTPVNGSTDHITATIPAATAVFARLHVIR
jgi:uncharacterized repeat protein (TIGR01451 family)